jgi:uracil DNA glycosylase
MFNHSVCAVKEAQHFTIKKIKWLLQFKKIIAVCIEKRTKSILMLCGQNAEPLIVKAESLKF